MHVTKTVILDFDGVILESVNVKTEAFRTLFSAEPGPIPTEIVEFHLNNGGMSRFDKFRHIYSEILHRELTEENLRYLSSRFSSLVFEKILNTPFVPGSIEFLQKNHLKFSLYVVSATPEDELRQITAKRGLTNFFQGIYGAPKKKTEHIKKILSDTGCQKNEIVFVGDAINDQKAADASGVRFIGRILPGGKDIFSGNPHVEYTITNLSELDRYLNAEG